MSHLYRCHRVSGTPQPKSWTQWVLPLQHKEHTDQQGVPGPPVPLLSQPAGGEWCTRQWCSISGFYRVLLNPWSSSDWNFDLNLTWVWWSELGSPHPQVKGLRNPVQDVPEEQETRSSKWKKKTHMDEGSSVHLATSYWGCQPNSHFLHRCLEAALWSWAECLHLQRIGCDPFRGTYS